MEWETVRETEKGREIVPHCSAAWRQVLARRKVLEKEKD
jgi:hypothetical protein